MFFHVHYEQVTTLFLLQFGAISTCKLLQISLALQAHAILLSLKNFQVLINTKLHLKSYYSLHKRELHPCAGGNVILQSNDYQQQIHSERQFMLI